MTRFEMMERISAKMAASPDAPAKYIVQVAHGGKFNGCDVYEITAAGCTFIKHRWTWRSEGTLKELYRMVVVKGGAF